MQYIYSWSSFFLLILLLFFGTCFQDTSLVEAMDKRDIKVKNDLMPANLDDLYKRYPTLIRGLFDNLNLNYPGLAEVKHAVEQKRWPVACQKLVNYYRHTSKDNYKWLQAGEDKDIKESMERANNVLENIFTFQGVTAHQPVTTANTLNWYNRGPNNDKEWGYFLNRQGYFTALLKAYKREGASTYAEKFSKLVSDWVLNNPAPEKEVSTVTWRQLEVGLRLTSTHWPEAFYGFQPAPEFSAVARILMLSSIYKQADYIMEYHRMHSNWASMELNGLAAAAFYWPEFDHASKWLTHATQKMEKEIRYEVYPDGAQNELTSHYHEVALRNFEAFYDLNKKNNKALPSIFHNTIIKMYKYLAFTLRPDGYGLLNNDSNLDYNRDLIQKAADKYDHPEWKFIAANGSEGQKPDEGSSVFFPWAGQMIMRSGWGPEDKWSFFDMGPWGTHHQHNDKLQLSVSAFGHDWLVDSGRYYYKWDKWRRYFVSSASHNVVLIDGKGQRPYKKLAENPVTENFSIQKDIVYAMGSFENGFGSNWWEPEKADQDSIPAKHSRAVIFLKNKYWVVIDHLSSQKPRAFEPLWHFAPSVKAKKYHKSIVATDSSGNSFQLIPSDPSNLRVNLLKGERDGHIQGWYSKKYNSKVANYCARYQTVRKDTSSTFAWVLYPSESGRKKIGIKVLKSPKGAYRLKVKVSDNSETEIAVRFYGKKRVTLSSGVILNGKCAFQEQGSQPRVACGIIRNKNGKVIAKDTPL